MESKRLSYFRLIFFVVLALFSTTQNLSAQTDKQIEKAVKIFFKKGYSEGIEKLLKYMNKEDYPRLTAYETWVEMEYLLYVQMDELYSGIELTIEDEENDTTNIDSLSVSFLESFKAMPKKKFIDVCRQSTMWSSSYTADAYLRRFLVDYDPDSSVSEKAKEYFTEGEEFFGKEDYELAELNYRKAINEDPNYYQAYLYLGDTFWPGEDYDSAIVYFAMAKNMHPGLLEPRKFIVDALMEQGLYYRAKKECMEALCVYAGFDMKLRMQKILLVENKYMEDHRFIRYFYPNDLGNDDQRDLNGIWDTYRSSKDKIKKYCSEDGIIEAHGETTDIYLEVYSMRRLLEKHDDELPDYLKFAYQMMEDGFLEPYVFISLFHVDIYPQFKHYMSFPENREKSMEYIEKYCIEAYPSE